MSKIRPHAAFGYVRADEVAETWDGVSEELYTSLWTKIVPRQKRYKGETPPEPDVECLSKYWKYLSEEEHAKLNELAHKHDVQYGIGFEDEY